jgi:hypothetical protein
VGRGVADILHGNIGRAGYALERERLCSGDPVHQPAWLSLNTPIHARDVLHQPMPTHRLVDAHRMQAGCVDPHSRRRFAIFWRDPTRPAVAGCPHCWVGKPRSRRTQCGTMRMGTDTTANTETPPDLLNLHRKVICAL